MTTDKPKSWQNWVTYAIVGLLVTVGPYVGGYLLLGNTKFGFKSTEASVIQSSSSHTRYFKHDTLRKMLSPLGWVEAKLRGAPVTIEGPGGEDLYEPR